MFTEDVKLAEKLITKDPESWDTLVASHVPFLENLAKQAGLAGEDARDCVQDSLASLWEDNARVLKEYHGRSSLRTYLSRIVHRDCLDFIRKENRQKRKVLAKSGAYILEDAGVDDTDAINKLDLEVLLDELGPRNRLLVKLIYYDGLTRGEVATVFGTKPTTVDVWHFRLKAKLRRLAGVEDGEMVDGEGGGKSKGVWSWLI